MIHIIGLMGRPENSGGIGTQYVEKFSLSYSKLVTDDVTNLVPYPDADGNTKVSVCVVNYKYRIL